MNNLKKDIRCRDGIIKSLTIEETIEEFKKMDYMIQYYKWIRVYGKDEINQMYLISINKAYNMYNINNKNNLNFLCLIHRILKNDLIDRYKKDTRKKRGGNCETCSIYSPVENEKSSKSTIEETLVDKDISVENKINRKELIETINKIVSEFTQEKQKLISMYFINNMSYTDISKIYGLTRQAISYRINTIKKELLKKFNEYNITKESIYDL